MSYQLTESEDLVFCSEQREIIPRGHYRWADYEEWCLAGNVPLPVGPAYVPYTSAHFEAIRAAAWEWMGDYIKSRRYDSIESCCSYVGSSVQRYKEEAHAMIAWRDGVNLALENLVLTLPPGIETWSQVCRLLPQPGDFEWPDTVDLPLRAAVEPARISE